MNTFNVHTGGLGNVTADDFLYCLGIVVPISGWAFSGSPLAIKHRYRMPMLGFAFLVMLYSVAGYTVRTICPTESVGIATLAGMSVDCFLTFLTVVAFIAD